MFLLYLLFVFSVLLCISGSPAGIAAWLAINAWMLLWLNLALVFPAVKVNTKVGNLEEDCCCHGTQIGRDKRKLAVKRVKREAS